MATKLNATREMLVKKYKEALEQKEIPWEKPWNVINQKNGVTNRHYTGVNALLLDYVAGEKGYKGTRWYTFNQIADKKNTYHKDEKWTLKKGTKGTPVEYWYEYDKVNKKIVSFEDYKKIVKENNEREKDFIVSSKTYVVFNENEIEGIISEDVETKDNKNDINGSEVIENIIENMGVIYEEGGNEAYYAPMKDKVVVPMKEQFKDDKGYQATQLHELCHATGNEKRLNRNLKGIFGTPDYAKEELRAEISSSFLMAELDVNYDESHYNNHIAYVQNWIDVLEKEPNELFKAIKDANEIVDYIKGMMEKKETKAIA